MKRVFCVVLIFLAFVSLVGCGHGDSSYSESNVSAAQSTAKGSQKANYTPAQSTEGIDIDLTRFSSTMIYSEVYNMMYAPDSYIGKTVRMSGMFVYYEDPETKNRYFSCIIADATACCSQGLEFVLSGEHIYPDDYPEIYSEITVTGTFEVYEENGLKFCRLVNAVIAEQ